MGRAVTTEPQPLSSRFALVSTRRARLSGGKLAAGCDRGALTLLFKGTMLQLQRTTAAVTFLQTCCSGGEQEQETRRSSGSSSRFLQQTELSTVCLAYGNQRCGEEPINDTLHTQREGGGVR